MDMKLKKPKCYIRWEAWKCSRVQLLYDYSKVTDVFHCQNEKFSYFHSLTILGKKCCKVNQ